MSENELVAKTRPFASENRAKSWYYVISTLLVLAGLAFAAAKAPYLPLRLLASVIEGLVIVRAFILAHDYQHGAILRKSKLAEAIFFVYGLLVLTPPRAWRQTHNYHHANTAKIIGSQVGSFPVLTVEMWKKIPTSKRFMYRAARHPLNILFGYLTIFLLGMCVSSFVRAPKTNWDSALAVVLHVAIVGTLWHFFGIDVAVLSCVLPLSIACMAGAYLFYAQHNFPDMTLQPRHTWSFQRAALESSSYMAMGPVMSWFTGEIALHHVHHLNAAIPFYRLREAMNAIPELKIEPNTSLHPKDIIACLRLDLWDGASQKMIPIPKGL
jgi:omega-6 fatty acid desaturase (delta-12 desaturase)